jgi:hypothetical protein
VLYNYHVDVCFCVVPVPDFNLNHCVKQAGNQVSFLARSTLKMESICSSETSIDFRLTIRRYIPEDRTLITNSVCICISNDRPNDSETPRCKNIHINESFHTSLTSGFDDPVSDCEPVCLGCDGM